MTARPCASLVAAASTIALSACAAPQTIRGRPDTLSLGRNAAGEPCTAVRDWRDAAVRHPFDQSWSITCRNVAASRSLGTIRVFDERGGPAPALASIDCGPVRTVTLRAIGPVEVRRCVDTLLGAATVSYGFRRGGHRYLVSAVPIVLGPAEDAARIVAGIASPPPAAGGDGRAASDIAVSALAPAPGERGDGRAAPFNPAVSLAEGIALNHRGLQVEASRVLNDALSRLGADTAPTTKAELLLEAGLADSNIRFSTSAQDHFDEAGRLIAAIGGERATFLARKRDTYMALDLLNQRRFRDALAALDRVASRPAAAAEPLKDPATVRLLNQPGSNRRGDVSNAIAVPETAALAQLVLDAQANWVRSFALLALGNLAASQAALDRAQSAYAPLLNERIDPTLVLWLGAQIERQRGRLQARRGDFPAAIASFDRALADLRRSALATAGTGTEPKVAEAQLERAGVIAQAGGDPARVRATYDAAVDALVLANQSGGGVLPSGIDRYLDILVAEADKAPRPDTADRFFRAVQAVGEPAVARQLTQLQAVVTADPAVGVKMRDRQELERTATRLRYEIAADPAAAPDLEKQRQAVEARLLATEAELSASARYRTVDDRPATIAEIRGALHPGEMFLKVTQAGTRAFAIAIAADRSWIYRIALPAAQIDRLGADVRASIDGKLAASNSLVPFDVAKAYVLFRLIAGPAYQDLLAATALVIDPAGPLQGLPAGVLVTDRASVDRYEASRAAAPFDFSRVSFLAQHATISTAVSPRSFLVVRALPPSNAAQPFLGLGQHQPATDDGGPHRMIPVGFGCQVDSAVLADLSRRLRPIDPKELVLAADALGVPRAPEITGAAFSDTAIEARRDLGEFQVLHFATHGLEEGVWGCAKSPPALVTSFGGPQSDGLLSFSEIARLRLDANLVVLSACDTASGVADETLARRSGQEEAGATLEGLVRAFLTANSRAVMATFWPVSADQETDRFIKAFYGAARTRPIGGALQVAQGALIADPAFSHPFYWGPYFVVGDAGKMMLSGSAARVADHGAASGGAALAALGRAGR